MNNEKEALVILTPGFPASEADTTCLPMQQQFITSMTEIYPQLNIIILSFQYPYFKKRYKWFNATVISFDGRNKGGLSRLVLRRKVYNTLNKIKAKNKIISLLSFWYGECAFVGKKFASKNDFKHYCWIFGQDAKKENRYPIRINLKAEELIALSDFLRDEFEKNHGVRPGYTIPFGTDPGQFSAIPKERDIDILAAGSLIPLKQYDIFLEIVTEINEHLPGIKAVLAGRGPEKESIGKLIENSGLQSTITLTGEIPHPELLRLMERTKVFLHPSSYEGFSGVCLEALSAGAAVISFCKPMNREIQHWHIVYSKEEMKQKTAEILQNPEKNHLPVFPFLMKDSVKAVAGLFSQIE